MIFINYYDFFNMKNKTKGLVYVALGAGLTFAACTNQDGLSSNFNENELGSKFASVNTMVSEFTSSTIYGYFEQYKNDLPALRTNLVDFRDNFLVECQNHFELTSEEVDEIAQEVNLDDVHLVFNYAINLVDEAIAEGAPEMYFSSGTDLETGFHNYTIGYQYAQQNPNNGKPKYDSTIYNNGDVVIISKPITKGDLDPAANPVEKDKVVGPGIGFSWGIC